MILIIGPAGWAEMISSVIDCYWQFDISKVIENDFDFLHFSKEKELRTY